MNEVQKIFIVLVITITAELSFYSLFYPSNPSTLYGLGFTILSVILLIPFSVIGIAIANILIRNRKQYDQQY